MSSVETYKMVKCRYYRECLPEIDSLIMVQVGSRSDYGFSVYLLEYNNQEGFLADTDLYQTRRKKSTVKEGQCIPVMVVRINSDTNIVDVTNRRLHMDEVNTFKDDFLQRSRIYRFGCELIKLYHRFCDYHQIENDKEAEEIMDIMWRQYDIHDHHSPKVLHTTYNSPDSLFEDDILPPEFVSDIIANINTRIIRHPASLDAEVEILVTDEDGLFVLRDILSIDEPDGYNLKVYIQSPPVYSIKLEGPSEADGTQHLQHAIDTIKTRAEKYNAEFRISKEITMLRESATEFKFLTDYDINKMCFSPRSNSGKPFPAVLVSPDFHTLPTASPQ